MNLFNKRSQGLRIAPPEAPVTGKSLKLESKLKYNNKL